MKKNRNKGDKVSIIEDGVEYFGKVTKATKKLCYVKFDDDDEGVYKYDELVATTVDSDIPAMLLSTAETVGLTPEQITACKDKAALVKAIEKIPLYKRASKKIGLTDVQIARHPDVESLKQYLNSIHPQSNSDARISEGKPPEIRNFDDNMPDSFTLESVIEAKFVKTNRDHYDRGNLQAFLCRVNRKYGIHEPVRIVQDRSFKVVKRELVTKFVIYYK